MPLQLDCHIGRGLAVRATSGPMQAAQARIIGISSFTAMERGADHESH